MADQPVQLIDLIVENWETATVLTAVGVYFTWRTFLQGKEPKTVKADINLTEANEHFKKNVRQIVEEMNAEGSTNPDVNQEELVTSLQETIQKLEAQLEEAKNSDKALPEATERKARALALIEEGKIKQAEAELEAIGESQGSEAAETFKLIGSLAYLHNTHKSLEAYQRATDCNPDDADAWNYVGSLEMRLGNLRVAEEAYNKVLYLGNRSASKELRAAALGNLGLIVRIRGDLDKAEDFHKRSLAFSEELGRKDLIASQLGNLGLIARIRGDLDQAKDFHKRSLALSEELGRKEGIANQLGNLGIVDMKRGDLDQAEKSYKRALVLSEELGRKEGIADLIAALGLVASSRGDLDQAEGLHIRSLTLYEELGRKDGMARELGNLGAVYLEQGDRVLAEQYWGQALGLFTEVGMRLQVEQTLADLRNHGFLDDAEAP